MGANPKKKLSRSPDPIVDGKEIYKFLIYIVQEPDTIPLFVRSRLHTQVGSVRRRLSFADNKVGNSGIPFWGSYGISTPAGGIFPKVSNKS